MPVKCSRKFIFKNLRNLFVFLRFLVFDIEMNISGRDIENKTFGQNDILPNISVFLQEHSTKSYQKLIFNVYSKQSKGKEAGKYNLNV
jgi:hypothetical protein